VSWCRGHGFVKVPGDGWKDLPKGVVNSHGQSFDECLKILHTRYCTHSMSDQKRPPTEAAANVKRQKGSGIHMGGDTPSWKETVRGAWNREMELVPSVDRYGDIRMLRMCSIVCIYMAFGLVE
jgi:hypothetical protein